MEVAEAQRRMLQAGCPSCHPAISVKVLKGVCITHMYIQTLEWEIGTVLQSIFYVIHSWCSLVQVPNVGLLASGADERHGKPPPGNQELLVVKDKVGRPQVSLW